MTKETVLDCDFLILNRIPQLYSARRFQEEIDRNTWKGQIISPESLNDWASQFESQNPHLVKRPVILYRQGEYRFWETQQLMEELKFPVINSPAAFLNARDKWKTYQQWKKAKVPTPETILLAELSFTTPLERYKFLIGKFGSPFVLKKRFSCQGRGVFLVNDFQAFENLFREQSLISLEHWLAQKAVLESLGTDIRTFMMDGMMLSIKRENKHQFLSNLHQGGIPSRTELSSEEEFLVSKIMAESGLHYTGIDFLRTPHGPMFMEANASPGFEGIETIYKANVAKKILSMLIV